MQIQTVQQHGNTGLRRGVLCLLLLLGTHLLLMSSQDHLVVMGQQMVAATTAHGGEHNCGAIDQHAAGGAIIAGCCNGHAVLTDCPAQLSFLRSSMPSVSLWLLLAWLIVLLPFPPAAGLRWWQHHLPPILASDQRRALLQVFLI